jgi:oligopeptide transport system permease protein
MENINLNIPKEKFRFADPNRKTGDKKLDTKQMSYAKDVFRRFCKNKSSVVAAIIIILLVLFAILVPIFCETAYSQSLTDTKTMQYVKLLPKCELFEGTGFWDGTSEQTVNENRYNMLNALQVETGRDVITKHIGDPYQKTTVVGNGSITTTYYDVRVDSYLSNGMAFVDVTAAEFEAMQKWQKEKGVQLIYPAVDVKLTGAFNKPLIADVVKEDANVWYETDAKGNPKLDKDGNYNACYALSTASRFQGLAYTEYYKYDSTRIESDNGDYLYALVSATRIDENTVVCSYKVRVLLDTYFEYRYGHEASFLFGTDGKGQDILTRLANGAKFSLILAICISAVNLFIGAIYGAIEGFYGGVTDLVMERISDVLGGMPSMVVMSLFQLHLASKVGPVWSMVFAFVLTGWLGMAARTRMQFYRFKRQEYVLSARTLGASDARLMFKHIFPNAMGTLITGSILMIPGVIFSESSLTYLGIVNLEGSTQTSVGTLLANGNGMLATFPHVIFWPALFISLLEISFNLFGNGLRDAFNPSLKGIED